MEKEGIRINLCLSRAGLGSRREADRMIEQGRVSVDGIRVSNGFRVMPGQIVYVDGTPVETAAQKPVMFAVHKPRGVVCTTDRRWGDRLLEDLIDCPERVFYAGRLDKNSEGLILMTNQGDLANKMMRSAERHEKEYVVTVDRDAEDSALAKLARGVYLPELGVTTRPCRVRRSGAREFHMILTQGLNRQIRRMCEACGYRVKRLVRIRIMNICLGDLPAGAWRRLTEEEEQILAKQIY